jgi:Spy/CpxP family protein refolding chaperone
LAAGNINKQGGDFSALLPLHSEKGRKMKAKKILVVEDDVFSRGAMEKILRKKRYSSFQRRIFIALILSLLMLFIVQISSAQESFPKMNRPNFRIMDSQETCWEALFPSLTEDQKKALESLRQTYVSEARPIRTELLALKIQLRYLLSDPNVQPRVLFDQQRKISGLQAKLEEFSLSYQVKARSIFTKEQWEKLPQGWAFEMGLGHEIPMMNIGRRSKKGPQ